MIITKAMIATYKRFRKVIRESVALEFFGKDFTEFKRRIDEGEDAKSVADEILTMLGMGSTRIVYGFKDNPSIVLKIIFWNGFRSKFSLSLKPS